MKKNVLLLAGVLLLFPGAVMPAAAADSDDQTEVRKAAALLREIARIPEKGMPPALLGNARGIAIIPGVIKVGFVIGGRRGNGIVLARKDNGDWGTPSRITLTAGSLGWQIGVQSTDVILVFKSRKSVEGLMGGKFTLGADAGVAVGPVGRRAEAATDLQLKAEVYSYSRSRGLFAGVSLEGSALQVGGRIDAPAEVEELRKQLGRR